MRDEQQARRSRPWLDEEFIRVDELKLVYTIDDDENFSVHLPGGGTTSVYRLRAAGHTVTYPQRIRCSREQFA